VTLESEGQAELRTPVKNECCYHEVPVTMQRKCDMRQDMP